MDDDEVVPLWFESGSSGFQTLKYRYELLPKYTIK